MPTQAERTFDIKNFFDILQSAKKGSYICPNCNEPKLTIAKDGKYNCWNCNDPQVRAHILTSPSRSKRHLMRQEAKHLLATITPDSRKQEWIEGSSVPESITNFNLRHSSDSSEMVANLLGWNVQNRLEPFQFETLTQIETRLGGEQ